MKNRKGPVKECGSWRLMLRIRWMTPPKEMAEALTSRVGVVSMLAVAAKLRTS